MKSKLFRLPALASLLAAALMTVALVGCGSNSTPTPPDPTLTTPNPTSTPSTADGSSDSPLVGVWKLDSLGDPAYPDSPLPGTYMSAEFSPNGSITGGAGCNSYRGSYVSSDDTISVDAMSFTEIGCTEPEGILQQEERFLLMLSDSATFEIDADALTLTTASGETLLFHHEGTIPDDSGAVDDDSLDDDASNANSSNDDVSNADSSLVGAWTLNSFGDPAYPDSPLSGAEITASFSADGTVSGNAGCNGFQGSYRSGDGTLSFGLMAITEMACPAPDGVLEQESRFFEMFSLADKYRMADGNLILTTPSGDQLLFSPSFP